MINSTVVFAKTCLAFIHYLILFNPFVQSVVKNVAIEFATNIQQRYAPVIIGVVSVAFFRQRVNN